VYVNESGKRKIDRRQEGEEGRERERERERENIKRASENLQRNKKHSFSGTKFSLIYW